jgi:methyl-accepting chemotaxis protein
MLDNVKVGKKLIGGFAAVLALLVVSSVMGFMNLTSADDRMGQMYQDRVEPLGLLVEIESDLQEIRGNVYNMMTVPARTQEFEERNVVLQAQINRNIAAYEEHQLTKEEEKQVEQFKAAWAIYMPEVDKVVSLFKQDRLAEALDILKTGGTAAVASTNVRGAAASLVEICTNEAVSLHEENAAASSRATIMSVVIALVAVAIGLTVALVLSRSISNPLAKCAAMLQEMGKGHLSNRVGLKRRDEIGILASTMDEFANNLQRNVVGTMQKIAAGDLVGIKDADIASMDTQDEIAPALKQTTEAIRSLVAETTMLATAGTRDGSQRAVTHPGSMAATRRWWKASTPRLTPSSSLSTRRPRCSSAWRTTTSPPR